MSRMGGYMQDHKSLRKEPFTRDNYFTDPEFPPNDRSLYREGKDPVPRSILNRVEWKRPWELVPNPQFVVDSFDRNDIDQGRLGNCWFIAAAAIVTSTPFKLLDKVVPSNQGFEKGRYTGKFHFNFWLFGDWRKIIVDDYLPTEYGQLIYTKNKETSNEFWPSLLEKAYAKLYGSYQALQSGRIENALVDMTGGISEIINIRVEENISPNLYKFLNTAFRLTTLMGACIYLPESSVVGEEKIENGLCKGHAYSITDIRQISTEMGKVKLLRLRNPWGEGEWKYAWSDKSYEMIHLSRQLKKDLDFENKDEGEFWISYEDFISNFEEIQLCHIVPGALISGQRDSDIKQSWISKNHHGAWKRGLTAGGCGNNPYENLYWKNPQFNITLESPDERYGEKCTLIVSLMKKERYSVSKISIGFQVYKFKNSVAHPLNIAKASKDTLLLAGDSGLYINHREVTRRFELESGTYIIIPNTFLPDTEAEFLLRLYTPKVINRGVLEEKFEVPHPMLPFIDLISETFERHAGHDQRMDAYGFSNFLEEMSANELQDPLKFPYESCRNLVTLMNKDKSGFLSLSEVKQAWKEIKTYRQVFKQFDINRTNTVDTYELTTMFLKLGFSVSENVLISIVRRYGGRDCQISFPDFTVIICKLASLFTAFHRQQKRRGNSGETAEFSRNEFLEATMFT